MTSKAMENCKILLVDDEAGIRNVLKITLESSGYDVCLASDGETGLKTFIQEKPCIVVTDIKMPGIDGIEVLTRIRKKYESVLVIMVTGFSTIETAIESMKASGVPSHHEVTR